MSKVKVITLKSIDKLYYKLLEKEKEKEISEIKEIININKNKK